MHRVGADFPTAIKLMLEDLMAWTGLRQGELLRHLVIRAHGEKRPPKTTP